MIRLAISGVILLFVFFLVPAYFAVNPVEYWLHMFPSQIADAARNVADWAHTLPGGKK